MFELLVFLLGGAVLRAVLGIKTTYDKSGFQWRMIDWQRVGVEILFNMVYGSVGVLALVNLNYIKGWSSWILAFVAGWFGPALLNVLAKRLGVKMADVQLTKSLRISSRQQQALDVASKRGSITNDEYQKITAVSDNTATRDLLFLVKKGFLKQKGKGRGVRYEL
ncbi:MAG: hypothetical protein Q7K43_02555 [Candidatus Woesearchaeota archaeon]|nr:hypothetical protein [Candidatus Woesearchaeota archaeon]